MRFSFLAISLLCTLMPLTQADTGAPSLTPGAVFTIPFPDLPPTFAVQKGEGKAPTQMSVRLPTNYSADRKFPICVFLEGGSGGEADGNATGGTAALFNGADYISVALPLFKKAYDPKAHETYPINDDFIATLPSALQPLIKNFPTNGIIAPGDYDTISAAYTEMLKKLNEVVPNIDPSRSALTGFSNGAHTIGVLLAKGDPVILQQFHSFAMVEGGLALPITIGPSAQMPDTCKNHRYLIIFSDTSGPNDWQAATVLRPFMYNLFKQFADKARTNGFDFTFDTTHTGHHFGTAERPILSDWIRQDPGSTVPSTK